MPTVAVLDEEGLLRGIEEVSGEDAAGRVRVPPNIDLPMDGSYWWDEDAQTFLALSQVAALRASKSPIDPDYAWFLALRALVHGHPMPDEVRIYVEWREGAERQQQSPKSWATEEALRALVRGEPMPDVVRQYVEWYDRHERGRAENRAVRAKQLLRAPRR
jgi:hypothetical protein